MPSFVEMGLQMVSETRYCVLSHDNPGKLIPLNGYCKNKAASANFLGSG